jgi:hypothetical protein
VKGPKAKQVAFGIALALLANISSCEEEPPMIGFVDVNGTRLELTKTAATTTTHGVEFLMEGGKTSVAIWVPSADDGKYSILSPFKSWRLTTGAVATATVSNDDGVSYAIDGEIDLTSESNSLQGSFSFQAKAARSSSVNTISGNWSEVPLSTISPSNCLLSNLKTSSVDIDFDYSQNGRLIHATGFDSAGYLFDKYITYNDERPIEILSKEGVDVFYSDSLVYQNDRISHVHKRQGEYLYTYTFSYQTSDRVSSVNLKQYYRNGLVDEWTQQISYDANGNQQMENRTVTFDSGKNPMRLLQQSLGNFSALPWQITSDWHIGLWNVNGPNNVVSIKEDSIEHSSTSYLYNTQQFPTRITSNTGQSLLEYLNCQ